MSDALGIVLDLVAAIAVLAFASLCLILAHNLQGSALSRGFMLAGLAGFVHWAGNLLTVAGDFGLVASEIPPVFFSAIQAVFMVMMFLAVRSFFPVWYKAFKKAGSQPFVAEGPPAPMQR